MIFRELPCDPPKPRRDPNPGVSGQDWEKSVNCTPRSRLRNSAAILSSFWRMKCVLRDISGVFQTSRT